MANPVLVEVTRSGRVENRHRGAYCITDSNGRILASAGEVDVPIYPRSSVKALQALALFESGAVQEYSLDDKMIAIACASHKGEPRHQALVQKFLDHIGMEVSDLECGAHYPTDRETMQAMRMAKVEPTAICHNCSGKHSGMLAVAKMLGVDPKGYVEPGHPVQGLVRRQMELVLGRAFESDQCGTDGCSIPTYAIPLSVLATGFARLFTGDRLPPEVASAGTRIADAVTADPFLIGGTGGLDSDLMRAFGGRLFLKSGAEGVFCGVLRDAGVGFALKIDDGKMEAAEIAIAGIISSIAKPVGDEMLALEARATLPVKTWREVVVGGMVATGEAHPKI